MQAAAAAAVEMRTARLERGRGKPASADGRTAAPSEMGVITSDLLADERGAEMYDADADGPLPLRAADDDTEVDDDGEEVETVYSVFQHDAPFRHAVLGSGPGYAEFAAFVASRAVRPWPP